uniref:PRELI/MSF1 domain-containing protein n=1 Tax=Mesocestoides corti TaxID=53468 RepID=A0A5K3FWJ1_MESCO
TNGSFKGLARSSSHPRNRQIFQDPTGREKVGNREHSTADVMDSTLGTKMKMVEFIEQFPHTIVHDSVVATFHGPTMHTCADSRTIYCEMQSLVRANTSSS